ncbi:MAG TPA: hypothetical protein VGC01_02320 [Mucilaginibacter sp.]
MMRRILLVSTDTVVLNLLTKKFALLGLEMHTLAKPALLFKEISIYQPDMLILDFILKDVNAGALCHQVTSNPETKNLPVVILSEYPELGRFSGKFGSAAIIKKSLEPNVLIEQILAVLDDHVHPVAS